MAKTTQMLKLQYLRLIIIYIIRIITFARMLGQNKISSDRKNRKNFALPYVEQNTCLKFNLICPANMPQVYTYL